MTQLAGTIVTRQTKFQFMEIMDTHSYGKCLVLDGRIQSSQADEFIYHETLVHPGLLAHPRPQRAMVIGGGEGAPRPESPPCKTSTHRPMGGHARGGVGEGQKHPPHNAPVPLQAPPPPPAPPHAPPP